jgi:hypothetical protein
MLRSPATRTLAAVALAGIGCVSAAQISPEVYLKLDFDTSESRLKPSGSSRATLVTDATALSGRSLHVERVRDGSYVGAEVPLQIKGSPGLRIAFVVRAKAMQSVAVNVFDQRRGDNTTPASPARIFDDEWHSVVFAAEDFHYNSDPPDRKIEPENDFASLMFHGQARPGAEFWVDKLVIYRGRDDRPPRAPSMPVASPQADGSVLLTWQEPADDTFAVVYSIHRKLGTGVWEKVGESLRPSFTDRLASPGLRAYRITAADYDNNVSLPSADVTATVAAPPTPGGGNAAQPVAWLADRLNYAENVRQIHARGAGKVRPDVFLFAGDSLTAATLYTHVLGSWLARGRTVRQGVGTVTTEYGAANIKGYLADAKPEFAVVMYGTNDQERGESVTTGMRNLGAVVDACVEFGTIPVLATIPPRGFDKRSQQGQERFNRALSALGRQKRVPVSYAFEEMMRHDLKEILSDGIHLQPGSGNEAAGRALRQTMDQVYFALRDSSRQ